MLYIFSVSTFSDRILQKIKEIPKSNQISSIQNKFASEMNDSDKFLAKDNEKRPKIIVGRGFGEQSPDAGKEIEIFSKKITAKFQFLSKGLQIFPYF